MFLQILRKTGRFFFRHPLYIAATLSVGFFAFAGALALTITLPVSPLIVASIAFIATIVIEGEVNRKNMQEATQKIFDQKYLAHLLAEREIRKFYEQQSYIDDPKSAYNNCQFIRDYHKQEQLVKQLKESSQIKSKHLRKVQKQLRQMRKLFINHILESKSSDITKPSEKNVNIFRQLLRRIRKLYIKYIYRLKYSEVTKHSDPYVNELKQLFTTRRCTKLQKEHEKKLLRNFAFWFINIPTQITWGIASVYIMNSGIASMVGFFGLSLAASTILGLAIPLAAIAALAYAWSYYNAITSIVNNDTVQKWWKKIKKSFTRKNDESLSWYIFRTVSIVLGVGLVVGLAIFATTATAGTWWTVLQKCVDLFPKLSNAVKVMFLIMKVFFVAGVAACTFGWSLFNTLETSSKILTTYKKWKTKLLNSTFMHNLKALWQTCKQNPSRIPKLLISLIKGGANKIKQDFQKKPILQQKNIMQIINPIRLVVLIFKKLYVITVFCLHSLADALGVNRLGNIPPIVMTGIGTIKNALEDAHYVMSNNKSQDKTDVPTKILNLLIAVPNLLAMTWDLGFSQLNKLPEKRLTFKQAWKKYYNEDFSKFRKRCFKVITTPVRLYQRIQAFFIGVINEMFDLDNPFPIPEKHQGKKRKEKALPSAIAKEVSPQWRKHNCLFYLDKKINHFKQKIDPTMGNDLSQMQTSILHELKNNIENDNKYNAQKLKNFLNSQYRDPANCKTTTTNRDILRGRCHGAFFTNASNSSKTDNKIITKLTTKYIPDLSTNAIRVNASG